MPYSIKVNLQKIQTEIGSVQLMVVSKNRPLSEIEECVQAGAVLFGENRVQEVLSKWEGMNQVMRKKVALHFIGHLQINKVKTLCPLVDAIQSVDSTKLANKIDQECQKISKVMPIFLEVNLTNEHQKYGFKPTELNQVYSEIKNLSHIQIAGLMCMARYGAPKSEIQQTFQMCKQLADDLKLTQVSMGMSSDYSIAIQAGSTLVRIGTKIFEKSKPLLNEI